MVGQHQLTLHEAQHRQRVLRVPEHRDYRVPRRLPHVSLLDVALEVGTLRDNVQHFVHAVGEYLVLLGLVAGELRSSCRGGPTWGGVEVMRGVVEAAPADGSHQRLRLCASSGGDGMACLGERGHYAELRHTAWVGAVGGKARALYGRGCAGVCYYRNDWEI